MIEYKVKIEGLDKLVDGLNKSPETVISELNKAVTRSVALLQNQTIKEAPVNKQGMGGNLRQSVKSRMTSRISGAVDVNAKYAIFVEEGTAPHDIRPKNKKGLANIRTGQFFGKLVHHPGTKANPFLQRAMDIVTPRIKDLFQQAIDNALKKISKI